MSLAASPKSRATSCLASAKPSEWPIYRLFFRGAIAVVLTLGASWGAWLLVRIAASGSFTAIGLHEVNAHGHAQIFGWVGLMVMSLVYHDLATSRRWTRIYRQIACVSFWLMLCGLTIRSIAEASASPAPWVYALALLGSTAEILAAAIGLGILATSMRASSHRPCTSEYFVLVAMVWFLVQAVFDAIYWSATLYAADPQQLLGLVATWQAPLREVQIHGMAMLMIFGVSQRVLPQWYGLRPSNGQFSLLGLAVLNAALVGIVSGFILMRQARHAWAGLWYLSILEMTVMGLVLALHWGVWRRAPQPDWSLKYHSAAYVWLFISLAMSVALPLYQFILLPTLAPQSHAAAIGFSHAYYGAIRHAVTVGFVSLALMGFAARLVVEAHGGELRTFNTFGLPFALLNIGCTVRVIGQTLTDISPAAFLWAGSSGLMEVTGLAIWGLQLWRLMDRPLQIHSTPNKTSQFHVPVSA